MKYILEKLPKSIEESNINEPFNPQDWFRKLGEPCTTCQKILITSQTISVCQCFQFCHENCFIREYCSSQNVGNKRIKCIHCDNLINLRIHYFYTLKCCQRKEDVILKILLLIFVLVLIVCANVAEYYKIITNSQFYWFIILSILLTMIYIFVSSLKK